MRCDLFSFFVLIAGWERVESSEFGIYYVNHTTRHAQYEHPCAPRYSPALMAASNSSWGLVHSCSALPRPLPIHQDFHDTHNVLVPANPYLYEEIPYWLQFYSRAPAEHDHKLRWELFRLPELDCYDNVLKRLYKQELEAIVMNYEAYRSALAREMENCRRRHHQQQLQQQQTDRSPSIVELKERALAQELETKV